MGTVQEGTKVSSIQAYRTKKDIYDACPGIRQRCKRGDGYARILYGEQLSGNI